MTLRRTAAQTEPVEILHLGNTHIPDTPTPTEINICDPVSLAQGPPPIDFVVET